MVDFPQESKKEIILISRELNQAMKLSDLDKITELIDRNSELLYTTPSEDLFKKTFALSATYIKRYDSAYDAVNLLYEKDRQTNELQGILAFQQKRFLYAAGHFSDINPKTIFGRQAYSLSLSNLSYNDPLEHHAILGGILPIDGISNLIFGDILLNTGNYEGALKSYQNGKKLSTKSNLLNKLITSREIFCNFFMGAELDYKNLENLVNSGFLKKETISQFIKDKKVGTIKINVESLRGIVYALLFS